MIAPLGTIRALRSALANDITNPTRLATHALLNSNQNAGHNTYLWQDAEWTHEEALHAASMPKLNSGAFGDGRGVLWGLPISVKDCFNLKGAPTSCGTKFYREFHGAAASDSWLVERLRTTGAVITGKTHLHALAYGITGENREFGDSLQPGDEGALTGGSSSGAAASVMEGSAVAAIGTDTGGSVRVPAVLCGLAGYRASIGRGNWRGGAHLAQSFDTMGWLFRDLEEAPLLGSFFAPREREHIRTFTRFAIVDDTFLYDCEADVIASYRDTIAELEAIGLQKNSLDVNWWNESAEIFAAIQAWEAADLHRGNFDQFEPTIRDRLQWGAHITPNEVGSLRERHAEFRSRIDEVFAAHELLLMPAAPVAGLAAGSDHSDTRKRLLRYTTPFSLGGVPAVAIPCRRGGMQLAAARDEDEALLRVAAVLGANRNMSDLS